jgi:hypothetical protein
VRERIDLGVLGRIPINPAQASQRILSVDIHGTTPTDSLPARPSESQRGVHLVLNLDKRIQNHRSSLVQVDLVRLELWLLLWMFWVPSVDFELFLEDRLLGGSGQRATAQPGDLGGP